MSRVVRIQTNFSSGEIDPLLRARVDLAQYYNALQTAENVVVQPQGGVKRRDGLKYITELPAAANPQSGVRLIPFEFSATDSYMFALVNQRIYIFRDKALITNINGSGNDYLAVSAITSAMLGKIRHAQSADTMILVHEDLTPNYFHKRPCSCFCFLHRQPIRDSDTIWHQRRDYSNSERWRFFVR